MQKSNFSLLFAGYISLYIFRDFT